MFKSQLNCRGNVLVDFVSKLSARSSVLFISNDSNYFPRYLMLTYFWPGFNKQLQIRSRTGRGSAAPVLLSFRTIMYTCFISFQNGFMVVVVVKCSILQQFTYSCAIFCEIANDDFISRLSVFFTKLLVMVKVSYLTSCNILRTLFPSGCGCEKAFSCIQWRYVYLHIVQIFIGL